ncbi:unnamed protein product [Mycena citricolor]|uniref:Nucleoporin n=1 Tax=Mycena citricolor TaxID=2018698 RepID=A0AAD2JVV0_9AGAR|nr:unnamed protein product [Mycena citricolor]CAK5280747.1 unnamed protein product [Mycena citricolor]
MSQLQQLSSMHSLPDKTNSEILTPVLCISDEDFASFDKISLFAQYSEPPCACLVMCKAWIQVRVTLDLIPHSPTKSNHVRRVLEALEPDRRTPSSSYSQLHAILAGQQEGSGIDQIIEYITPRLEQLRNFSAPFGKPSDASKKKVEGGAVVLDDGVTIRVEDADKEYVWAVSTRFQIDQVHALVLLRSFLYNQGLPSSIGSKVEGGDGKDSIMDELLAAITPFFHSERVAVLRTLLPIFRASSHPEDPLSDFASAFLPKLFPDGTQFAESLLAEYVRKTRWRVPPTLAPREAAREAKQNSIEQLILLEVLFVTVWDYAPCDGPLVTKIYEAAYDTQVGGIQANGPLLTDDEAVQLAQDTASVWILIMIEVLELEALADPEGAIEISDTPSDEAKAETYTSSPKALMRIHELVTTHEDVHYACVYMAWAFVLSRLSATILAKGGPDSIPSSYKPFFEKILPQIQRSFAKDRDPVHLTMARACLSPQAGLLEFMLGLLTTTPIFVSSVAWKRASHVTDPNALAYRAVFKGLIIAIVEVCPVEEIPQFDTFVDVWIALFGRSESKSVAEICAQYWESDWRVSEGRRAIFNVARARFPVQFKPLIRLLRAMTGMGFLDTDPLCAEGSSRQYRPASQAGVRDSCARHVFYYLDTLSSYAQVIPVSKTTGAGALYERQPERFSGGGRHTHTHNYVTQREIRLPGGSSLRPGTTGPLMNTDGGDMLVVCWQHAHSGWKMVLEVLTHYVNKRQAQSGAYQDVSFARHRQQQQGITTLKVEDVGIEADGNGVDETVVTEALNLVQSLIQHSPEQAEQLMVALEAGNPVVSHVMAESQPPDLVQLTTTILEEALSASSSSGRQQTQMITSAIGVLSAILALPRYSHRVWLYIRSTAALFGSGSGAAGFATHGLVAERVSGRYPMTLALLHLAHQLTVQAFASIVPDNVKLQNLKEEVLMRVVRFLHTEVWLEYPGWRYAVKAESFDIGRLIMAVHGVILEHAALQNAPFPTLLETIRDLWLWKATTSTISPLISFIATGVSMLSALYEARLMNDVRRLVLSLSTQLRTARLALELRIASKSTAISLLEQAFCSRVTASSSLSTSSFSTKTEPIDVLASYVKNRMIGTAVPLESTRLLTAICLAFSLSSPAPGSIIGHVNDAEATVGALVRIVRDPYEEMALRSAVWRLIAVAVQRDPALGMLFVVGKFVTLGGKRDYKGKGKETEKTAGDDDDAEEEKSALSVAANMLESGSELWELNPQLLACGLRFLEIVWQRGLEHRAALDALRQDAGFWERMAGLATSELGPVPEYTHLGPNDMTDNDDDDDDEQQQHSSAQHDAVAAHSYRTVVRAYALKIFAHDIAMASDSQKPLSYTKIEPRLKSEDDFTDLIAESSPSWYDPALYDDLTEQLRSKCPSLTLEDVRAPDEESRDYGDNFAFDVALFRTRLEAYAQAKDPLLSELQVVNMNLSLTHAQTALTESCSALLGRCVPFLRSSALAMASAASVSYDIAAERRSGDLMAAIHGTRLSLLLALLEVAWFDGKDSSTASFIELVENVHGIIRNEAQPPAQSFVGETSTPFHRTLLLILYFCARNCGILINRPKALNADQRLKITALVDATLALVIDALSVAFVSGQSRGADPELDRDMQFLVAVFEQCVVKLETSSTLWLVKCQETDLIRISLELLTRLDLSGLSDLKQPLYVPHVLLFHMTLAAIPSAAERFASAGVLSAYSNNSLSAALSAGAVDVTLSEFPAQRSPAHVTYCTMLSVVAGVITSLGRCPQFAAEASGMVLTFGEQVARALSWTVGDAISLGALEEMEAVVAVFSAIAESGYKEVEVFSRPGLRLLQQLNYAITHPNHLATLIEPITVEERACLEKDAAGMDPLKRPLVAHLMHRLFRLSSVVLSTLVTSSRAYSVLASSDAVGEALVVPHTKIVPGEIASMGTLLELGNTTLDLLKDLTARPAGQTLTPGLPPTVASPVDVKDAALVARGTLEAVLLYAATQLALWLSKPDPDFEHDETMEAPPPSEAESAGRRMRRGVTAEITTDLHALLNKAKLVLAKCDAFEQGVDLTGVLSTFMLERIGVA